uniref:Immunoglobulin V-set domain-containing protein n=1 Tax=Poecilia mexicana TaxID=48701 RepID=A0A3B3XDH6_9TELE
MIRRLHTLNTWTALSFVISAEDLIHVFGYEGRSVTFSCSYGRSYKENEKYLCKNDCGSRDVIITTKQKNDKYSIYDVKWNRVVKVTISDLRSHDAGKYWCGVTRQWYNDLYTEVRLPSKVRKHVTSVSDSNSSVKEPNAGVFIFRHVFNIYVLTEQVKLICILMSACVKLRRFVHCHNMHVLGLLCF